MSSTTCRVRSTVNRDGFVISEGGAVLVLEELEMARAQRRDPYGEIARVGFDRRCVPHHSPSPGGAGAIHVLELALADAGLTPGDIVHINAHGTSTPLNDAAEAEAMFKVFGSPGKIVTSTKGVPGHALGGAGALEAVAVLLSMLTASSHRPACYENADPEMPRSTWWSARPAHGPQPIDQ